MQKALKGVPEKERVMPQGVVNVGGEVYYVENQPGQGVPSLGLDDPVPNPDGTPATPDQDGSTPPPQPPVQPSPTAPRTTQTLPTQPTPPKWQDPRDKAFGT
jgi:hypothetical protein